MFYPKLFTTLKDYSRAQFFSDAAAGVIVGVVALPLAIAFAIASGVSPDRGLVTAVVAGFLISFFGGSRVQIGGPTGAFVVIVYAIVQKYGMDGLLVATFMAGILLIIMGAAGLGSVIKFIPYPVTVGFTSGIALIILSSQVKDFFGLSVATVPADFIQKWEVYGQHFHSLNLHAIAIGAGTVLIIQAWKKFSVKIPGSLVALVIFTAAAQWLHWPVETIGSRFGDIPHTLPAPHLPHLSLALIQQLFPSAITIALLAGIESLLSAVVSDGMIGGRHRSNMELVAQGIANIASPLFGGMPATGAIARTTTNVHNGGRTPVAGIIHALTLLLIMFYFGPLARLIPLACLAGILVVVSYHMCEWRSFMMILRSPRSDVIVLLITFILTVVVDLTVAIEVGMILAAFLFVKRMSTVTNIRVLAREIEEDSTEDEDRPLNKFSVPRGVEVFEVDGPLFFGAANQFDEADRIAGNKAKVRILRLRDVRVIDATGMHALKGFYERCQKSHIPLIITGLHVQPLNEMIKNNLYELIGEANVFNNMKDALERARALSEKKGDRP